MSFQCCGTVTIRSGFFDPNAPVTSNTIQYTIGATPITNQIVVQSNMNQSQLQAAINSGILSPSTTTITITVFIPTTNTPSTLTVQICINTNTEITGSPNVITLIAQAVITSTAFVCQLIRRKKRRRGGISPNICIPPNPNNPNYCPPGFIKDENGNCCYKIRE